MKILHTGDWHIGKIVHGQHMIQDQKHILNQLIDIVKKEKPDVLLITGDIYDRSQPSVDAVELLDEVLSEIILKCKTKVIAIAGNHDNPYRVEFASRILRDDGLFISGNLSDNIESIVVNDEHGAVNFYTIPFCEPAKVKELYGDETIKNCDLAMQAILNKINKSLDTSARNVCITHGYITGIDYLETSESERPISVGGSEYINVEYFNNFNYVALGHLHSPQKVKNENIRYSGSLLKYSFSEVNHEKSVMLIEMDAEGKIELEKISLEPIRDMRIIKGNIEDLTDKDIYTLANTDDYIMATITNRGELLDPMSTLRAVYPNILKLVREEYDREAGENKTSASDFIKKNPLELFEEFYENVSGEVFDENRKAIIADIVDKLDYKWRLS